MSAAPQRKSKVALKESKLEAARHHDNSQSLRLSAKETPPQSKLSVRVHAARALSMLRKNKQRKID